MGRRRRQVKYMVTRSFAPADHKAVVVVPVGEDEEIGEALFG